MVPSMWNLAKSAEAVFSGWAIKRVCKYFLKKKLGEFLLGDLDLDQLNVQLGKGTIQLTDVALNVGYINRKLGSVPAIVKEGSIASLLVKIPWKGENCQIEVEEVELVLAPRLGGILPENTDKVSSCQEGQQSEQKGIEDIGHDVNHRNAASTSLDVHEGVKTIAKMVKWLLTSLHIRIKSLICAFDPCLDKDENRSGPQRIAILRIPETELGTCVSEDVNPTSDSGVDGFLGSSRLTNFVKFQGVIFELLEMDNVSNQSSNPISSGTAFSDRYAVSLPSGAVFPILTGDGSGFSGMLKLSIPWKNGSLDIQTVNADVSIDPIELRLQPDTINWIITLWECLKNEDVDNRSNLHDKVDDITCIASTSFQQYFTGASAVKDVDRVTASSEKTSVLYSSSTQETVADTLLPGTHVIPCWVPYSINRNVKDSTEAEEYEASVDQFFECFDGMRSSQTSVGNSGIWNWTSSVFSAITTASSLASGSVYVSSGQQHVETNVKASVAGISIILSFCDEDKAQPHYSKGNNRNIENLEEFKSTIFSTHDVAPPLLNRHSAGPMIATSCIGKVEQSTIMESTSFGENVHYLEAQFQNLVLNLQVCPQKSKFGATLKCFEVNECFGYGQNSFIDSDDRAQSQMLVVQRLQAEVQGVLPLFPFSAQDLSSEERKESSCPVEDPLCTELKGVGCRTLCKPKIVSIKLLTTLGESVCQFDASSSYLLDDPRASTTFSAKLPPFILWLNFNLINMLLDLSKKVRLSSETSDTYKDYNIYEGFREKHDFGCHGGNKRASHMNNVKDVTSCGGVEGVISLSHSRVVLCFPYQNHGDSRRHFAWEEFICIDFFPSLCLKAFPDATSQEGNPCTPASSIHLNFGNLNVYSVISADKNYELNHNCAIDHQTAARSGLLAENILSGEQDKGKCSSISISWQAGSVTGPWLAKKAWCFSAAQDSRCRNKVMGKGCEFASVTTAEDLGGTNSCLRQEMILSSTFVLQIHVSRVSICLKNSVYKLLNRLIDQVVGGFACASNDTGAIADDGIITEQSSLGDGCASQLSVVIDFDSLEFSVRLEKGFNWERGASPKQSRQAELPGSWDAFMLTIEKFGLLSVSNIGGISGASFVWLSHGEGELLGFLNVLDDEGSFSRKDYRLISCKNATMQRGGGEGTNTMMFGSAGSNIIYLWDPQLLQSFLSITVRCGTAIAPGGRLDWLNEICCFFRLPAEANEQTGGHGMQNESSEDHAQCGSSFFLEFVDVALSYEPHVRNSMFNDKVPESECSSSANPVEESGEPYVACLLAAASLNFSNKSQANSTSDDFSITLHDVGLLLSTPPWADNAKGMYSVEYLQRIGYVKVAGEAIVEASLQTNCRSGLLWELECSDCHVNLDTCHDTTAGLIRLVGQLQQLFAPDIEEFIVHLQNRWDDVQQAHEHDATTVNQVLDIRSGLPTSSGQCSSMDIEGRPVGVGLMDKILEDAFYSNRNHICLSGSSEMGADIAPEGYLADQEHNLIFHSLTSVDSFGRNASNMSVCEVNSKNSSSTLPIKRAYAIEGYGKSELYPLLKSSENFQLLNQADEKSTSNYPAFGDFEGSRGGWYKNGSLQIIENHVSNLSESGTGKQVLEEGNPLPSGLVKSSDLYKPRAMILLKNIDVRWRMHAGSDWSESKNVFSVQNAAGRDSTLCLEVTLSGMDVQYAMFPDGEVHVSNLSLSVQDFHLHDCSRDAPWKMVLGYYNSKEHPRESSAKAVKLDLECVRPDPVIPLEEYRLQMTFLPVRLHLDQRQLNFLISFFTCKDPLSDHSWNHPSDINESRLTETRGLGSQAIAQDALLPFFQKCDIWPGVVRVDYIPHHIDLAALRGGNYAELLNVVPWKGIDLQLKDVHAVGIYGWSNVCETVIGEWLEDISHNQVHKLLKGLAPIRSLVAVSSGAAKLVSLPVKSYRKDHRLLKGVQRGAVAFLRSISIEAVGLGVHLAAGAHEILLQTEYILTSIPPLVPSNMRSRESISVRSNQPKDAQQGIKQAYESLSDGLGKTATALVGNPIKVYQRGAGMGSALASAVRAAPLAAIAPASAAARAVHCALLGVRNSIDSEHRKESMEKYLGAAMPQERRM